MVELSRVMRKVSLELYSAPCEMEQKVFQVKALDAELERWHTQIPVHLQPQDHKHSEQLLKPRRVPSYVNKQRVVLQLRKH